MPSALRISSWARQKPLITVTGPTGTGKSQLAIHLARRFSGEIVNSDVLQIYHGLPIATNKLGSDEMKDIPHHLLDIIDIREPPWTVSKYVREAENLIDEIHARGNLPIVVGGTHYYVRSLLCSDYLVSQNAATFENEDKPWPILEASTSEILSKLQDIDPVAASWWHPREHRKIRRSLEICLQTGQKVSDIYQKQKTSREAAGGNFLKYDALCLHLYAERSQLNARLDKRVDRMISDGLVDEARFMGLEKRTLLERGWELDETKGIWIAIGFKEFEPYLDSLAANQDSEDSEAIKVKAREKTKIATRQYAVRQARYVKHKILPIFQKCPEKGLFQVLDATSLESWSQKVAINAEDLATAYLMKHPLPDPKKTGHGIPDDWFEAKPSPQQKMNCELCKVTTTTPGDWERHVRGRKHKIAQKRLSTGSSPKDKS